MKRTFLPIYIIVALTLLASCAKPPATGPENSVYEIGWWRAGIAGDDSDFAGLADAVRKSLEYYSKLPPDAAVSVGDARLTAADQLETLERFLAIVDNAVLTSSQKLERIRDGFALYRSVGSDGRGGVLVTGYYEPVLSCRLAKDDLYRYPIYRRPDDMIEADLTQFGNGWPRSKLFGRIEGKRFVPFFSREEIEKGKAIEGKGLEILWCSDPLDIYFLQVQGSGKADLGDGTVLGILYDAQNGRPYKSVGKYLLVKGALQKEQMSMQAIREYLKAHPDEADAALFSNPSYVFFRLDTGPSLGNIGVPLTPGRSIATDTKLFAKGALAVIKTERPVIAADGSITSWAPFTRFVVNQDTGGAIKGAGRVDLFWGGGKEAEISAGNMKQNGELYFLVRKK